MKAVFQRVRAGQYLCRGCDGHRRVLDIGGSLVGVADIQDAQVAVASTAETLAGAETLEDGLASLGLVPAGNCPAGQYRLIRDGFTVVVTVSEESGDYPGTLYSLSIDAEQDGKKLAGIKTAKYDGGRTDD